MAKRIHSELNHQIDMGACRFTNYLLVFFLEIRGSLNYKCTPKSKYFAHVFSTEQSILLHLRLFLI